MTETDSRRIRKSKRLTSKDIELVIKNFHKENFKPTCFTGKVYLIFNEKLTHILHKIF